MQLTVEPMKLQSTSNFTMTVYVSVLNCTGWVFTFSPETRSHKMKVESLCVSRRAYVKIYLWGSDANDTKTGTILDVAEEYLVNVGDMTLWTLSHFLQMVNHFDISLAPSFLSVCNQVGWLRLHIAHVCLLLHSLLVWPVTWKITFQVQHFSPAGKDFVANQCHKRYLPVFKL